MNRGPGDEEKVGYQKTSNFPSIGVFTVSPRPWELTDCLPCTRSPLHHHSPGQALASPFSPEWDLSYCLLICQQWERPNQDVPLLPLLAQEPHGGLVMLRMHHTSAQGQPLPLLLSALKTGKKNVKFQNPKIFLPSYFQKKWMWSPHQVGVVVQPQTPGKERNVGKTLISLVSHRPGKPGLPQGPPHPCCPPVCGVGLTHQ